MSYEYDFYRIFVSYHHGGGELRTLRTLKLIIFGYFYRGANLFLRHFYHSAVTAFLFWEGRELPTFFYKKLSQRT